MQLCTTPDRERHAVPLRIIIFLLLILAVLPTRSFQSRDLISSTVTPLFKTRFDQTIVGKASWYGHPFHGRTTANGERYNMHLMTAAHKTLPFNAVVKVTNLVNGKTALVRINDRGPYIAGRNIDLSFAAAQVLGMVQYGVAPVKLEIIMPQKPKAKKFAKR
jgi:rare lipoprotein A (peptidoglycan hydrolase)